MDATRLRDYISELWTYEGAVGPIVSALEEYIRIPNLSPAFEPEWADSGFTDQAVDLLVASVEKIKARAAQQGVPVDGIATSVISGRGNPEPGPDGRRRTPLIRIDVPAFGEPAPEGSVLLYGHMDKQPGLEGRWSEGLGPQKPVIRDGKLYGRGGADDGYAIFSALSAILAVRAQGAPHARATIIVEAAEESGSEDLDFYIRKLQPELGDVGLIVCLDSGAGDYDRLWTTESLRGVFSGILNVGVMRDGMHSGTTSGIVPSPFRILRLLLSRLEDEHSGEITSPNLLADIPDRAREQAALVAKLMGTSVYDKFPFLDGVRPVTDDIPELLLNSTWRPTLVVKGMGGIPANADAGNVMLPDIAAGLSFRLPPTLDSAAAARAVKEMFEKKPPYGSKVEFAVESTGDGFAAPEGAEWFVRAVAEGSREFFGTDPVGMGEGGSIPFMGLLNRLFPKALFLVTGVLGPHSNAHGSDEFLHLPAAQKVTMCVAKLLAAQATA